MTQVIKDGRTGNTAEVNADNQLETFATQRTQLSQALLAGDGYIITTPFVNLTTAGLSAILHLANTDTATWIINRFFVNIGPSNINDEHSFQLVYNSSTGTLLSGGAPFSAVNLNAGSAKTLTATILSGVEGSTISGGTVVIDSIVPATGARTAVAGDNFVLPPGTSAQVTVTPPAGNTNMNAQAGFLIHRVF